MRSANTGSVGDGYTFECSTNGSTWNSLGGWNQPLSDNNYDQPIFEATCAPAGFAGNLTICVVDTDHSPGNQSLDTVTIDEVFVRVLP